MVPQIGIVANYVTLPYGHDWQLGATLVIFNLDRCVVRHIQDICDLEYDVLLSLSEQLSWKDFPIEWTYLFHTRIIWVFLNKYMFCQKDILGCVEQHTYQYKVQHRLSLHCQIIIWVCKDDVKKIRR
jgi:hypothetical protein